MNLIFFIDVQLALNKTTSTTYSLILKKIQTKVSHALHELILASSSLAHHLLKSCVKLIPLNLSSILTLHEILYKTAQESSNNFHALAEHRYFG